MEESYNGIKRRDRAKLFAIAADEWVLLKSLTLLASSRSSFPGMRVWPTPSLHTAAS
jgi:hypothetical protein